MRLDAAECLAAYLAANPAARLEWSTTQKLRCDPRVTPIGALLRKSSLDELPQLFNVLLGDMSLVGPRPIVQAEAARYGRYFAVYCSVKPGITGLWQVSGRSEVGYRRRVAMDVLYARRRCTGLDAQLLALTIPAVLFRKGAY
jgi:exopolysaccharide production protein ExoY